MRKAEIVGGNMANIVLCCGKPCSGKSTFSKKMEREHSYFPFSADEWMLHFYGETTDLVVFHRNLQKCKEMIYRTSERLLAAQENVILDFGFWTRTERREVSQRFQAHGHRVTVLYFPIATETQRMYLEKRQNSGQEKHYTLDRGTLAALNGQFEEPGGEEDFVLVGEFDPWKPGE